MWHNLFMHIILFKKYARVCNVPSLFCQDDNPCHTYMHTQSTKRKAQSIHRHTSYHTQSTHLIPHTKHKEQSTQSTYTTNHNATPPTHLAAAYRITPPHRTAPRHTASCHTVFIDLLACLSVLPCLHTACARSRVRSRVRAHHTQRSATWWSCLPRRTNRA